MARDIHKTFVPVRHAAAELGVPLAWLKREAEAGRIPAVQAGKRWLVHLKRTRAALTVRAEKAGGDG